ncbi:MAG: hypothetical protein IKD46_07595 [Lentisphaeria bacterium]|nr:hypothetical protein [Lentisphaeria bacterium]
MAKGGIHPNTEKVISPCWGLILLLAAFSLLYEPWLLGLKDYYRQEGLFAAFAQEMNWFLPVCTAHGTAMAGFPPFFPYLGKILTALTGLDTVFALRLVSVFMTFATGVLILISVWRSRNFTAAAMAAGMFWGSNVVLEKSLDAMPNSTAMFGLLSAQLCWIYIGQKRGSWSWAWGFSLPILALTFLAGGLQTLLLFFLPMIFLRRPLTLWPKLTKPGMLIGLFFLAAAILLGTPAVLLSGSMPIQPWQPNWNFVKYLNHLWQYPLDFLVRFLPWNIFLWAPFCVALQTQDTTPIFSKYLRTIALSTFFLLWLSPGGTAYDMLYLAPSLSMLCGMYYEAAVTRYAPRLRWLVSHAGGFFVFAAAMALLLFCVLPEETLHMITDLEYPVDFRKDLFYQGAAFSAGVVLLILAGFIAWGPRQKPLWTSLLLITLSLGAFFYLVMFPYRIQEQETRNMAKELASTLHRDRKDAAATVYKFNISDLYAECSLMNAQIRRIYNLDNLPFHEDTVYLVGTAFPQQPDRDWTNLLPADRTYRNQRICLWKGVLRKDDREVNP